MFEASPDISSACTFKLQNSLRFPEKLVSLQYATCHAMLFWVDTVQCVSGTPMYLVNLPTITCCQFVQSGTLYESPQRTLQAARLRYHVVCAMVDPKIYSKLNGVLHTHGVGMHGSEIP